MSLHIETAVKAIVNRAVCDADLAVYKNGYHTLHCSEYRPYVEACVAAETAELRAQMVELKLANDKLAAENARLKRGMP